MGADLSAENTPNAPEFICPNCLPKPKRLEFQWKKASLGVRVSMYVRRTKFIYWEEAYRKKQTLKQTKLFTRRLHVSIF